MGLNGTPARPKVKAGLVSKDDDPSPSSSRVSRRNVALTMLIIQNASVSLLTRLSRVPAHRDARIYIPTVAVFTAEVIKFSVSLSMLVRNKRRVGRSKEGSIEILEVAKRALWDLAVNQRQEVVKLAVPAALYALQNTLLYVALSNLDAATYQSTYQLKLVTAAVFSVIFLKRSLSNVKWFSLCILVIGVIIVQLDGIRPNVTTVSSDVPQTTQNPKIGFLAILAACVSSGLAGGWFEYVLKAPAPSPSSSTENTPLKSKQSIIEPESPISPSSPSQSPRLRLRQNSPSLWARNLQLSVPSLFFSLLGVFLSSDFQLVKKYGFWQGFNPLVWGVVTNQAIGGLLVALVVREADSVAKGFATSVAIVVSTLASIIFFGLVPGPLFIVGAGLVIISTVLYAKDSTDM